MSAHTPKPWTMRAAPESSYGDFAVQIGRDYVNLHNEGDAKLIAAAPQLLEALQAATDALEILRRGHGVVVSEACYPALNIGRRAIAEATS